MLGFTCSISLTFIRFLLYTRSHYMCFTCFDVLNPHNYPMREGFTLGSRYPAGNRQGWDLNSALSTFIGFSPPCTSCNFSYL